MTQLDFQTTLITICHLHRQMAIVFLAARLNNFFITLHLPPCTRLDHYIQCCINAYENLNKDEPLDEEFNDMDFWREVVRNIEENANI